MPGWDVDLRALWGASRCEPQQLRPEDLPDTASRRIPQEGPSDNLVDLASDGDDHATATDRGSRLGVTDAQFHIQPR